MDEVEWSNDAVRDMFVDPNAESKNPTDNGGSDDNSNSSDSATPTGAIAGGVVGGVAGLAIIGGLIFFFLRRRRNTNAAELHSTPYQGSSSLHQPLPSKYHDGSSPMSGMENSSNGMSELPTSTDNTRYELDASGPKPELSGDYSQSPEGRSSLQRYPQGFGSAS